MTMTIMTTHIEKNSKKILDFVVDRNENVVPLHREIKEKKIATFKGKNCNP